MDNTPPPSPQISILPLSLRVDRSARAGEGRWFTPPSSPLTPFPTLAARPVRAHGSCEVMWVLCTTTLSS